MPLKHHNEVDQSGKRGSPLARKETGLAAPVANAIMLLEQTAERLRVLLQHEIYMADTPLEVQSEIESAADAVRVAAARLASTITQKVTSSRLPGRPTRQQGQFLAFIHEYIMRNKGGVAPSHADLQRFFNLTPPSVNSMLIRLEQRGFIRRIPGQARAIELTFPPAELPALERPFKF